MLELPKPLELVEKIILETRSGRAWIALSMGGFGMLVKVGIGRHLITYQEERSTALKFASQVLSTMGFPSDDEQIPTPQILLNEAVAVIDDPENNGLLCTTWQYMQQEVEICSVGTNSVLVFEGNTVKEIIDPHSINTFLRSQGYQTDPVKGRMPTHALGDKNTRNIDDVRIARIPLLPSTAIAIIVDRRLADAIIERAVPRNELPSFIEAWSPAGKRIRTSVLISL